MICTSVVLSDFDIEPCYGSEICGSMATTYNSPELCDILHCKLVMAGYKFGTDHVGYN